MIKRLVAAAFISAVTVVGVAPAAGAAPSSDTQKVSVAKPGKPSPIITYRIDWD